MCLAQEQYLCHKYLRQLTDFLHQKTPDKGGILQYRLLCCVVQYWKVFCRVFLFHKYFYYLDMQNIKNFSGETLVILLLTLTTFLILCPRFSTAFLIPLLGIEGWRFFTVILKQFQLISVFISKKIPYFPISHIYNWPLKLFSKDYGLASHTTHGVCINFICEWRDLEFNVDSDRKFF